VATKLNMVPGADFILRLFFQIRLSIQSYGVFAKELFHLLDE
jgi:hypothetical protein